MPHILHLALRVLAGIVGAISLYAALFLYEDEHGNLENRLEDWWVKLDDERNSAVSRHTAFMREVARLAGDVFDRVFGKKLLSPQAFGVSSAFTIAGVAVFALVVRFGQSRLLERALVIDLAVACIAFAMIPALSTERHLTRLVYVPVSLVAAFLGLTALTRHNDASDVMAYALDRLPARSGVMLVT